MPGAFSIARSVTAVQGPWLLARSSRASRAAISARSATLSAASARSATRGSGPIEAELDPVGVPIAAQGGTDRLRTGEAGAPSVALGDPLGIDDRDRVDREQPGPRQLGAAGPDGRAAPAPERERHLPRGDRGEIVGSEEHYWFACSAAFRPLQRPLRCIASIAPDCELRRNSRPSAPLSSAALTTSPSGSATREPPVT